MDPRNVWRATTDFAVILILLAVGDARCADDQPGPKAESIVRGKIVDAAGNPIAGTSVSLYRYAVSPSQRWGRLELSGKTLSSDEQGRFRFSIGGATFVVLSADAKGFARTFIMRPLSPDETIDVNVVLAKPATVAIELTDPEGRPVDGARVRSFSQRGANGGFKMSQLWMRSLDLSFPASDASGRLFLPSFPEGDSLKVTIEHPRLAPLRIDDLLVKTESVAKGTMRPGVVLTLRQSGRPDTARLPSAVIDLRHELHDESSVWHYEINFDSSGVAKLAVEPGPYDFLRLQHDDFYLTPTYLREGMAREKLEIAAGRNDNLIFDVRRRIAARGRVVDAETNEPVVGASLLGEIASEDSNVQSRWEEWSFTDWGETDSNGEYTLPISAGRSRVSFDGSERLAESQFTEFDAAADSSTIIPEIRVRRIPKIVGVVQKADGSPMDGAVVRLRGRAVYLPPVLTDAQGRFELQPTQVTVDDATGLREVRQSVLAFDPHRSLAAVAEVRLDQPAPVRLTLEPKEADWPLTAIPEALGDWQRGIVSPEVAEKNARITLKGKPAPELDAIGWINSEPLKLADLRGKYVLLDFWFTGCGPCHYDFPSVKLVHELYKDKGVVVIGIHNNSSTLEAVRQHVEKIGLAFPVMVDHPDGRTVARFEPHGVPDGYPCYVLIDPAGNVLFDDRTIPTYTLRSYKLEIIRKLLLER